MPQSIRDAVSRFDLESRTVVYAVCPKCHCTYKPQYDGGSTQGIYKKTCTNRPKPKFGICGESLLHHVDDDGHQVMKPLKPFIYHDLHDYLASLLSQPDLESAMDKSCNDLMEVHSDPIPEHVMDIWQVEFLRTFKGLLGKTLFIDGQGEGRYGFTLNIDFFNVEGIKVCGATTSCGIISMVCLNLPYDIRYDSENIFIASIIPGPHTPSTMDLTHYIKPLIDDLVVSWENGVRYSRTTSHPMGRMTHSAIIAAVIDLPAARHASQLAGHGSHFYCSVCQCFHLSTLGRIDHEQWVLCDAEEMGHSAYKWLNVSSTREWELIFQKHGGHWSELWQLSYWNPTWQLVVDAMHCILEGQAQHHFCIVLGLTSLSAATSAPPELAFSHNFTKVDPDDKPFPNDMNLKEVKQVATIHQLLMAALGGTDSHGRVVDQGAFDQSLDDLTR